MMQPRSSRQYWPKRFRSWDIRAVRTQSPGGAAAGDEPLHAGVDSQTCDGGQALGVVPDAEFLAKLQTPRFGFRLGSFLKAGRGFLTPVVDARTKPAQAKDTTGGGE